MLRIGINSSFLMLNKDVQERALIEHDLFYESNTPISPKYVPSLMKAIEVLLSVASTYTIPVLIKYIF